MSEIRYRKITLVDGTHFILRITSESPKFVHGYEVNAEGDEIVPPGYQNRHRSVERALIAKAVEMRMNNKYATLESMTHKTPSQLDAEIAEALHGPKESHRTRAQNAALRHALEHGQVFAGWNPSSRARVSANVLRALERAGLLKVSRTSADELVGALTQAGAIAARATKEP